MVIYRLTLARDQDFSPVLLCEHLDLAPERLYSCLTDLMWQVEAQPMCVINHRLLFWILILMVVFCAYRNSMHLCLEQGNMQTYSRSAHEHNWANLWQSIYQWSIDTQCVSCHVGVAFLMHVSVLCTVKFTTWLVAKPLCIRRMFINLSKGTIFLIFNKNAGLQS